MPNHFILPWRLLCSLVFTRIRCQFPPWLISSQWTDPCNVIPNWGPPPYGLRWGFWRDRRGAFSLNWYSWHGGHGQQGIGCAWGQVVVEIAAAVFTITITWIITFSAKSAPSTTCLNVTSSHSTQAARACLKYYKKFKFKKRPVSLVSSTT